MEKEDEIAVVDLEVENNQDLDLIHLLPNLTWPLET